ncbi:MAG: O-antigen ligase family protein [Nostocaceae cyanobacterium]|nr:O-antigen ligase family protein [Nostocaceae cyanobacterium]
MKPQNFEERLIWYFIIGTYGIYVLGMIMPLSALLGWVLFFCVCKRWLSQTENTPENQKIHIPWVTWVWCMGMLVTLFAMYMGMTDFKLGTVFLLRGTIGWAVTSVLLALFLLSGCLPIRPEIIYRAVCILCVQSLIAIPIAYAAAMVNLPGIIYSSPIERLIQNGPIYYNVGFYEIDFDSKKVRLLLFAPWCPALGLVSNIYFFLALQERNRIWRFLGLVGAVAMNVVSVSRAAMIYLPLVLGIMWFLPNLARPTVQIAAGIISTLAGIFNATITTAVRDSLDGLKGARASSNEIRAALARIALDRWKEAPIWGHGTQEPGPKVVANMPIGSHHTWVGLLFTQGIVGFFAVAIPILCSFIDLVMKVQYSQNAKVALSILLTLFLFSFSEQIDILSYLCWPGLILMGIAFQEKSVKHTSVFSSI